MLDRSAYRLQAAGLREPGCDPEDLFYVRLYLLHGANYNDPAAFNHAAVARFTSAGFLTGR